MSRIFERFTRTAVSCVVGWCSAVTLFFPTPCLDLADWNTGRLRSAAGFELCETKPAAMLGRSTGFRAEERCQHLRLLGVDRWQGAGCRGQGVKIAILDSGFRGYRDFLGSLLPERVITASFRTDKNLEARRSQHGIYCGEVIHALAPDAEILLANWDADRPDEFLQAVRWARDQGAKILSCSLIMPSWSDAEGGGPVHEELGRIIGDGRQVSDPIFFASAGNTAQRHWTGLFHPAPDGCHEWEAGSEENDLTPWGNEEISVELCCPAKTRFDVYIDDETSGRELVHSVSRDRDRGCFAIARFWPVSSHHYGIRVRQAKEVAAPFHIVALGGWLHYATSRGSIPFPADGPSVVAVGAVDQDGHRTLYSSCGPNSKQPKPDLVAPVPFPSFGRDIPFSGTSAAAPQAAAVAALWWCQHHDWTANKVKEAMLHSARDLGPKGHDFETGYGMIALPAVP